jgi:hypothetical protein
VTLSTEGMVSEKEDFNLCLGSDLAWYRLGRVKAGAERLDVADVPASAAYSVERASESLIFASKSQWGS